MRIFILSMFLFTYSFSSSCYTAFNGYKSVANTEKDILQGQKDLMSSIDDIHDIAKKRADLELQIIKLNNQILNVRKSNLKKLKKIEFYERNKYVSKNTED